MLYTAPSPMVLSPRVNTICECTCASSFSDPTEKCLKLHLPPRFVLGREGTPGTRCRARKVLRLCILPTLLAAITEHSPLLTHHVTMSNGGCAACGADSAVRGPGNHGLSIGLPSLAATSGRERGGEQGLELHLSARSMPSRTRAVDPSRRVMIDSCGRTDALIPPAPRGKESLPPPVPCACIP